MTARALVIEAPPSDETIASLLRLADADVAIVWSGFARVRGVDFLRAAGVRTILHTGLGDTPGTDGPLTGDTLVHLKYLDRTDPDVSQRRRYPPPPPYLDELGRKRWGFGDDDLLQALTTATTRSRRSRHTKWMDWFDGFELVPSRGASPDNGSLHPGSPDERPT